MRLQLQDAICHSNSFVLMLRYGANLKAIRYKSMCFNRIIADKLYHVIAARDKKMRVLVQTTTFRPLLWCANAVDEITQNDLILNSTPENRL